MGNPAEQVRESTETLHVVPAPAGGWAVKRSGNPSPLEHFDAKEGALAFARERVEGDAIVVHAPEEWLHSVESGGKILRFTSATEARPNFGSAKGQISMAEDFDAPLDNFSEYMP